MTKGEDRYIISSMIHKWKFNKGDKIINKKGEKEIIKDRWLDESSNTGEWYSTKTLGTSGSGWKKYDKNKSKNRQSRI